LIGKGKCSEGKIKEGGRPPSKENDGEGDDARGAKRSKYSCEGGGEEEKIKADRGCV